MGEVTVRLLGGFAAAVDGVAVPETAWRLKKARELVKMLALALGHRLHREQAMDVLWRDRGPAAAANNLHQAVHVARRALGAAAIELRDEVFFLAADIDVDRLELAAADARRVNTPASYGAALSLYGGELLPQNCYDDWAERRREELAALAVELTDELAAIGPAPALGLPADASSFVGRGRGRELAELRSLLGRTRLLTLSGTAGAGKTRLALELARGAEPAYEAGAALVELAALADARLIPDAVAAALDLRVLPTRSSSTRSSTSSRRARCCSFSTTASICCRRRRRFRTGCSAPRRCSRSSRRVASPCACRARSCSGFRRSTFPIRSDRFHHGGCSNTRPCRSSPSGGPRSRPGSPSTSTTPRTSRVSASASTACRSRSSWLPDGSGR